MYNIIYQYYKKYIFNDGVSLQKRISQIKYLTGV